MKNISLSIKNIHHSFNGVPVLNIISLDIFAGEKIALLGPSGAGKTTLLNILSGNLTPSSGDVFIGDKHLTDIKNNKLLARHIGILRQQFDLILESTVLSNVMYGNLNRWGFIRSLISLVNPKERNHGKDILSKVGLLHKASSLTSHLSGGEQQRVAISRLIMQSPSVVLCDEPVASLDPKKSHEVLSLLCETLHSKNRTIISTLHSVETAVEHFDRIIGIKDGEIFFDVLKDKLTHKMIKELYDG